MNASKRQPPNGSPFAIGELLVSSLNKSKDDLQLSKVDLKSCRQLPPLHLRPNQDQPRLPERGQSCCQQTWIDRTGVTDMHLKRGKPAQAPACSTSALRAPTTCTVMLLFPAKSKPANSAPYRVVAGQVKVRLSWRSSLALWWPGSISRSIPGSSRDGKSLGSGVKVV